MAWVDIGGSPHPAIVVRLFPAEDRAVVLCGTGTKRDEYLVIPVPSRSAAGQALKLTKDTYFYATHLRNVRLGHLKASAGLCPPALFLQVRMLVEGTLAILTSDQQLQGLAEDAIPTAAPKAAVSPSTTAPSGSKED